MTSKYPHVRFQHYHAENEYSPQPAFSRANHRVSGPELSNSRGKADGW